VQLQEDILGGLFGEEAVVEDAERDAEDHGLVFQHQVAEGVLRDAQENLCLLLTYTKAGR
jgi:hypothetical protein